jgi:hypothetical protein
LTNTVALPSAHFQVFGPQQAECVPGSPMRSTG